MPKKIAIYSRKSRVTAQGESIENQIELCRQYISTHFLSCHTDGIFIYEDEGFSGGNTQRPQFKRMIADAKAQKFSAIICYRLDRISRNIGDFAKLIEELDALGISFISIKEQFDTASPMGRAMMYISSVFSQLERETIAERIRDNMHELAKTGRWLGGITPTGYVSASVENINVEGKIKKTCHLKIAEEEGAVIRRIFAKFLETNSLTKTETYFLQQGYKTKNGRNFSRFTLKNILTNPVYMAADKDAYRYFTGNNAQLFAKAEDFTGQYGIMAYNRTLQKPNKAHQIRPIEEWIVAIGRHKGLISAADWVCVQQCLAQNSCKAYRKPRSNTALLSGLLFCADCGGYLRPKLTRQLNKEQEYVYPYLCTLKEKSRGQNCRIKNASGNLLDKALLAELKKLTGDNREFLKQLQSYSPEFLNGNEEYEENLRSLHRDLGEKEKQISALISLAADAKGSPAADYILPQIDNLHKQSQILKSRLKDAESQGIAGYLPAEELAAISRKLCCFGDMVAIMDTEQKRAALRACVKKVIWDGDTAHIYLHGAENAFEPLGEYSK